MRVSSSHHCHNKVASSNPIMTCRNPRAQTRPHRERSRPNWSSSTSTQTSTTISYTSSPRWRARTTPPGHSPGWSWRTTWRRTSQSSPMTWRCSSSLSVCLLWETPRLSSGEWCEVTVLGLVWSLRCETSLYSLIHECSELQSGSWLQLSQVKENYTIGPTCSLLCVTS